MHVAAQAAAGQHAPQRGEERRVAIPGDARPLGPRRGEAGDFGIFEIDRLHASPRLSRRFKMRGAEAQQPRAVVGGRLREQRDRRLRRQPPRDVGVDLRDAALSLAVDIDHALQIDQPARPAAGANLFLGQERHRLAGAQHQNVEPGDVIGDDQPPPRARRSEPPSAHPQHREQPAMQRDRGRRTRPAETARERGQRRGDGDEDRRRQQSRRRARAHHARSQLRSRRITSAEAAAPSGRL